MYYQKWSGNRVTIMGMGVLTKWSGNGIIKSGSVTYQNSITAFLPELLSVMAATDICNLHTRGCGIHPSLPCGRLGGGGEGEDEATYHTMEFLPPLKLTVMYQT